MECRTGFAEAETFYLLPAVIFTSGILSAFFVNDIVCLIMVPFVLTIAQRMGLAPLLYLLAVATASNIGSVATITGNPQNILIGSFSGISYREFLVHLGPVALIGLLLDWGILHLFFCRNANSVIPANGRIPLPVLDLSQLGKPVIVATAVVIGFFFGVPPAMMAALGAAVLLISRTRDPQELYKEVDWGLLVFFVGLFLIVGGAENAGIVNNLLRFAQHWNLQRMSVFTGVVAVLSNLVSNVPAVMLLKSLVARICAAPYSLAGAGDGAPLWLENATITGSVANIIVVETAKPEVQVGFWDYFRVAFPSPWRPFWSVGGG